MYLDAEELNSIPSLITLLSLAGLIYILFKLDTIQKTEPEDSVFILIRSFLFSPSDFTDNF